MTTEDFNGWYDHHCSLFPDIRTWLGKKVQRQAILDQWQYVLEGIDALDAKAASRRLYEAETRPRTYADHPLWIAKECRRQTRGRKQSQSFGRFGEKTYGCSTCHDSGYANIYDVGELLRKGIQMYGAEKAMTHIGTIYCDCETGRSLGCPNLDRSYMILAGANYKSIDNVSPELAERRRAQVEAMVAEMANVDAGCPF